MLGSPGSEQQHNNHRLLSAFRYNPGMSEGEKHRPASTVKPGATSGQTWALASLIVGLLTPSTTIFFLEVFVGHISPISSLEDILRKQFGGGNNLFLLALFGLIPFVALSIVCRFAARRLPPARLACLAIGGMGGIASYMIPAHVAVWYPLYSGGHMSSTAVIAFVVIPFYCLGPLAIGLLVGWAVSVLPTFSVNKTIAR
jgi:hypothetical protein